MKAEVLRIYGIIFSVAVLTVIVGRWVLEHHDRKVKIDVTKTWTPVTATILDAQSERQYRSGSKGGTSYHCYHIRVGYDFNKIHYTSEIEFLKPCEPDAVMNADYNNAARYYYPLNYRVKVLVDPNNPQHVRDADFIKAG